MSRQWPGSSLAQPVQARWIGLHWKMTMSTKKTMMRMFIPTTGYAKRRKLGEASKIRMKKKHTDSLVAEMWTM